MKIKALPPATAGLFFAQLIAPKGAKKNGRRSLRSLGRVIFS